MMRIKNNNSIYFKLYYLIRLCLFVIIIRLHGRINIIIIMDLEEKPNIWQPNMIKKKAFNKL